MAGLKYGEAENETKLYMRENSECREGAGDRKDFLKVGPKITSNIQAAPGQWATSHITLRRRPRVHPGASGFALQAPHLRAVVGVLCAREPPGQLFHQVMPRPHPAG